MGSGVRHGSSRTHGGPVDDPVASQRYVGNLREQSTRPLRADEQARLRRREAVDDAVHAVRAFGVRLAEGEVDELHGRASCSASFGARAATAR